MPLHIRSLCLAPAPRDALRTAALSLLRETPALVQVQCLRAIRHIPSDSVTADRAGVAASEKAAGIGTVLELHFDGAAAAEACTAGAGWAGFREQVNAAAPILFSLDAQANVPVTPQGPAVDGGFRRWMLLTRKAASQEQFRDAWFGRHARLARELPHVDGYLQNLVVARHDAQGRELAYEALPVDGVAELCFADEAAMERSYASDARLPLRDDGRELLARITTILVQGEAWR